MLLALVQLVLMLIILTIRPFKWSMVRCPSLNLLCMGGMLVTSLWVVLM